MSRVVFTVRYRKVNAGEVFVRKHEAATSLFVIISGAAHTYESEPKVFGWHGLRDRKSSLSKMLTGTAAGAPVAPSGEAYSLLTPTATVKAGEVIGEVELQQAPAEASYITTAIAKSVLEVMEISRDDYDRILKADGQTTSGTMVDLLRGLRELQGSTPTAIHRLSQLATTTTFSRGQLCLAYPPDKSLSSASASSHQLVLILSGAAKVLAATDPNAMTDAPLPTRGSIKGCGPDAEGAPPRNLVVERHVGSAIATVATLGKGEVLLGSLFHNPRTRWCLRPTEPLELLIVPKDAWNESARPQVLEEQRRLTRTRADFFSRRLLELQTHYAAGSLPASPRGQIVAKTDELMSAMMQLERKKLRAGNGGASMTVAVEGLYDAVERTSPPELRTLSARAGTIIDVSSRYGTVIDVVQRDPIAPPPPTVPSVYAPFPAIQRKEDTLWRPPTKKSLAPSPHPRPTGIPFERIEHGLDIVRPLTASPARATRPATARRPQTPSARAANISTPRPPTSARATVAPPSPRAEISVANVSFSSDSAHVEMHHTAAAERLWAAWKLC